MSGGGSKTQTTTSNTKTDPYAPAVPALQKIVDRGTAAFDSGVGSQVYGGDRVAGLGDTTKAGLDAIKATAGATAGTAQAGAGFLSNLLSDGGSTVATQGSLTGLMKVPGVDTSGVATAAARMGDPNGVAAAVGKALTGGDYALDETGYRGLLGDVGTTTQTERSLQDTADGKFLGGSNPYLQDMIDRATAGATSAVGQKFAASGRYGSGRFAGATAEAASNAELGLRYSDYDAERARIANAATSIDAAGNALTGIRSGLLGEINSVRTGNANQAVTGARLASGADAAALTGATTLAGIEGDNNRQALSQFGTALSTAQGDRAAAQTGLGQIAGVQADIMAPGQTLAGIGAVEDEEQQKEIAADQDVFNEQQAEPWNQAGLLAQLALPVAGAGSTSTGTSQTKIPQPSLLQQLLGGGLAIAGTASKFMK
ncbi:hypothetical protein [Methylobacterium sp. Leaf466]|uniref:hypothetical protein n=1 Tax=Methylobacterium sp. Leaf466 TaxID=1736386 RepID=UPI0006FAD0DF|nr:hypothetical protein [Methylobacterium sp. Leaf466]KQT88935.1 hypothetical protein ASG59_13775 [Methylobacterium sp. Leaf466]